MVVAVRQYGRWLRDNYADLEHKEVWLSLALLIGLMILLMSFEYTDNYVMSTIAHLIGFPLAGLLLWRVETLKDLSTESRTPRSAQRDACLSKNPSETIRLTFGNNRAKFAGKIWMVTDFFVILPTN